MGKTQFITREQEIILDEIKRNDFLRSNFYFTGGTALSSFYLQHRESEDLDLFSEKKFDNQIIFTLMEELGRKHNFTFESRFAEVVYVFNLTFKNKENLKVDFAYYPYKRIEKGITADKLEVDSVFDITTNKLLSITQRTEVKDFVDLYFLFDKYTMWDLIPAVKLKFGMEIDPFLIAADFMKVDSFEFMPKMLKPLTLLELQDFFKQKAKELAKRVIE